MANIANFEVNGVSYSYDTESRNPLSNKVKAKAFEGKLVYDANTKAPTEIVGIPANSLKAAGKVGETSAEPVVEIKTATIYGSHTCGSLGIRIKYKGNLRKANLDNFYGTIRYGYDGCGGYTSDAEIYSFYIDDREPTSDDNFFEFVDYEDPGSFTMYGDDAYLSDFGYRA